MEEINMETAEDRISAFIKLLAEKDIRIWDIIKAINHHINLLDTRKEDNKEYIDIMDYGLNHRIYFKSITPSKRARYIQITDVKTLSLDEVIILNWYTDNDFRMILHRMKQIIEHHKPLKR